MGALLGLTFGLGLLLIWQSALGPRRSHGTRRGPRVPPGPPETVPPNAVLRGGRAITGHRLPKSTTPDGCGL